MGDLRWNNILNICKLSQHSNLLSNSSPLDKMDAFSQTMFSDAFSLMKKFVFWLKFDWILFPRGQLIIIQHWFKMDWHWTSDKPLSEPMLTWFTDAYMQHWWWEDELNEYVWIYNMIRWATGKSPPGHYPHKTLSTGILPTRVDPFKIRL